MSSSPLPPNPPPSTEFSFRRMAVPVFGPSLLFGVGEGAILPIIPLMARDLGTSMPMAALVVALIAIGSLLNNISASLIAHSTDRGHPFQTMAGSIPR